MRIVMPAALCAFALAACSGKPEDKQAGEASQSAATAPTKPAASAAPAVARKESVSNDLYEFDYAYPVQAAVIPDLRKWLDADLEKQRGELIENAQEGLDASKKDDFPFNPYGSWTDWKVVTDLPGWLSLSGEISSFEGGAHPNHGFTALIWDKQANVRREAEELFTSEAALARAIQSDFCRAIDKQRAEKRGEPVQKGTDDPFSECLDPTKSTIILGSSNGKAFDRIGVLVAPYEAGPYAEGSYEVTLPVTDAVLAAVKPQFRATFVKGR